MGDEFRTIGQSIRPMLVALPLGLLSIAVLFDVADLVGGPPFFGEVGYWNLIVGVAAAALAALAGVADLLMIPLRSPARRAATTRGMVHIWAVGLFALVWLARSGSPHHSVRGGLFLVELVAFGTVGVAAWLGIHFASLARVANKSRPRDEATVDVSSFFTRPPVAGQPRPTR
jgi:uncharacterized membrane protein